MAAPKTNQTITFATLVDKLTNSAAFNLSATASSQLAVSFSIVSGPATVSGNVLTLTGSTGTVVVRAAQPGNATFNAAPNVDRSFLVTAPAPAFTATITVATAISCNGGSNGSLTATATNGNLPYSYLWSNGSTTATITALAAGSYNVRVTSADGKIANATTTLVAPTVITTQLTITNTTPGTSVGAATIAFTGGTAPYTVSTNGGTAVASTGNFVQNNLAAGTYTFVIKDTKACSKTITGTVVAVAPPAGCSEPAWTATNIYTEGNKVSYNSNLYKANWWTQGDNPATNSGTSQVWTLLGPCATGANVAPVVSMVSPTANVKLTALAAINLIASATDADGTVSLVRFTINGQKINGVKNGNQYTASFTPTAFGSYPLVVTAKDNSNDSTSINVTIVVEQTTTPPAGNFIITEQEYNAIFPYRFGVNTQTGIIDPANDFFSYANFKTAVERMANISCTFERRTGTNLYRITRKNISTGQQIIIRTDPDFNATYNQSKAIITQIVNYGNFVAEGSTETRRREMSAFLANISQETTGGWATAPGGQYAWGLYFREEVGYENNPTALAYRDEGNTAYPPAPGKSYHGRGPIQLSWNYNYGQVSEFLYGSKDTLLKAPEKVTQDGALAFQTALWFWMTPQNPKPSAHDVMAGNWLPNCVDVANNRKPGLGMTVNIINGGLECGSGTENQKVTNRIGHYTRHAGILVVSRDVEGTNTCHACGCASQKSYAGYEAEPGACGTTGRLNNTQKSEEILVQPNTVFTVWPNPATDVINMQFELAIAGAVQIEIIDMQGRTVKQLGKQTYTTGKQRVQTSISKLPPGMYLLKKTTLQGSEIIKLNKLN